MTPQDDQGNQKWYQKILDNVKTYQQQVGELETSVSEVRKKYDEVVARNIFLEEEISQRTNELQRAQQSLLSLSHIWETMRTAEPLGNVLSLVSNSLIETLDYEFCCIMQLNTHKNKLLLRPRSFTENQFLTDIDSILEESITSIAIPFDNINNPLVQVLKEDLGVYVLASFQELFDSSEPEISPEKLKDLDIQLGDKPIVLVPIKLEEQQFGILYAISKKSVITDPEKDFLKVFAGQIELAVTITRLFEQVREQAITDGLTKISNRRHFDQCLAQEAERAKRLSQPFSLVMLDMDHLKLINDTHGHSAGDAAIVHIADTLKDNARAIDLPSRFGGEEFAVLLPGVDTPGALIAAERIRAAIENKEVPGVGTVTASIGVATFLNHTDNLGELLELADQAMYEAKQSGRNQVKEARVVLEEVAWQQLALNTFLTVLTKKGSPITPDIARDLIGKLKSATLERSSFVDMLYETVDILIATSDVSRKEGHTRNVVNYSVNIAKKMGLSPVEVDKIRLASLLHDLGKASLPQDIISKPGPLNDQEWDVVISHPVKAAKDILAPLHSLDHVVPLVQHHHERWDGKGYPDKISGEEIPIGSRIISVADAYCAMTSDKPYREAMTMEETIEVLKKGADTIWDPAVVKCFIDFLSEG